jgi:formylglycine-generating enzyme required for sulfatase activity
LASGEQWEKAARGPSGRRFPYGEEFSALRANVRESRRKALTPVDWYDLGTSPYGIYDLCGNAWEWTNTWDQTRVQVRGGAFTVGGAHSAPQEWVWLVPGVCRDDVGFRCVAPTASVLDLLST